MQVFDEKQKRENVMNKRQSIKRQEEEHDLFNDQQFVQQVNEDVRKDHAKLLIERESQQKKYKLMLQDNDVRLDLLKKNQEKEKIEDQLILKQMMQNEEEKERKREAEFKTRIDKIQAKMSKMADTVVKNERDKQLKEERRLLALQTEKERRDLQEEQDRKNRLLNQNRHVQSFLSTQITSKQESKVKEKNKDKILYEKMLLKNRLDLTKEEKKQME